MSRRLALLNAGLKTVGLPLLRRTKSPEQAAREFAIAARILFRKPAGLRIDRGEVPGPGRPLSMATISCGAVRPRGTVLYLHGGGYVSGSAATHRGMIGRLSALAGVSVTAPDYRLAQEAPFPAAFEDAVASWEAMLAAGHLASEIVLGGDSAGGGLALALLSELCRRGTPPAGLFAFSPWTDLTLAGDSLKANAGSDVILPATRVAELAVIVLGGTDPADPRISPLYAEYPGAPPVYLQASRTEILLDDTRRMAGRLRRKGVAATVDLWADAPHVWQIFDGWIPEARAALERAAAFVSRCLKQARPPAES